MLVTKKQLKKLINKFLSEGMSKRGRTKLGSNIGFGRRGDTKSRPVSSGKYPKENIKIIEKEMTKQGVSNQYARIAMLAVMAKESGLVPKSEKCYNNTANARIKKIFGKRVPSNDAELTALKSDCKAFFNQVYGSKFYGSGTKGSWAKHNDPGDGYKYRGRGLNQITFKASYAKRGKLAGVDLVANPDKLNNIDIAAKVGVSFLVHRLKSKFSQKNNSKNWPPFKSQKEANIMVANANAGWGKKGSALSRAIRSTNRASKHFT